MVHTTKIERLYQSLQKLAPTTTPSQPIPSAVCILWRNNPEFQIYLAKRSPTLRFLAGFWTFPGGKIDAADRDARTAACRELLEETGVQVRAATLEPAGQWVTPSVAPLRFSASYFLAKMPEDRPAPDWRRSQGELVDGQWFTPGDILERFDSGELLVPAPALRVVRELGEGMEGAGARIAALAQDDYDERVRQWVRRGNEPCAPPRICSSAPWRVWMVCKSWPPSAPAS